MTGGESMVEVILVPMTQEEFAAFREVGISQYAAENVKAGYWHESEAVERSRQSFEKLLPDGIRTADNHFFTIRDKADGKKVGSIWMRAEWDPAVPRAFIFEFFIEEPWRGKGYGKQAMKAIEAKAKELGLRMLMLHVFCYNRVAVHLYEISGFKAASLNMIKEIP